MSDDKQSSHSLDKLNKQVHDLNYVEAGKSLDTKKSPDPDAGRRLAEKIQGNIEAYRNEIDPLQRPNPQAG